MTKRSGPELGLTVGFGVLAPGVVAPDVGAAGVVAPGVGAAGVGAVGAAGVVAPGVVAPGVIAPGVVDPEEAAAIAGGTAEGKTGVEGGGGPNVPAAATGTDLGIIEVSTDGVEAILSKTA